MATGAQDRSATLIVRVWLDGEGAGAFRARISYAVGLSEAAPEVSAFADVASVCREICARLEAFSRS